MKTIFLILFIVIVGYFFREHYYTINLGDTYYILSYLILSYCIALVLILVKLVKFILKKYTTN